jgi:transcriptional regulator with GAF, ATPase, and Fis domain
LGKFEIAHGGTIFLDEVGTISLSTQIKLLQVLQESVFQRVGGEADIQVDVRIIAATNIDLKSLCSENLFRSDLYYRLNVFPIHVPPLRKRKEDISLLTEHFLNKLNQRHSKEVRNIDPDVMSALHRYNWPGNIRELENIMERAHILERSSTLTSNGFPEDVMGACSLPTENLTVDLDLPLAQVRRQTIERIDQDYIVQQLRKNRGRIDNTAKATGVSTRQLNKLMVKYSIRKEDFK